MNLVSLLWILIHRKRPRELQLDPPPAHTRRQTGWQELHKAFPKDPGVPWEKHISRTALSNDLPRLTTAAAQLAFHQLSTPDKNLIYFTRKACELLLRSSLAFSQCWSLHSDLSATTWLLYYSSRTTIRWSIFGSIMNTRPRRLNLNFMEVNAKV